jgi:NTP pyrophosphatase (non-canonical NTP hydrolase)
MNPKDYIDKVLITESIDFPTIMDRLDSLRSIRLLHAAMGMETEVGEFMDQLKKHFFYGKELDIVNLMEEVGDLLWYVSVALDELGYPMEKVMEININKLKARYKGKFKETQAKNRDLLSERLILEDRDNEGKLLIKYCAHGKYPYGECPECNKHIKR